MQDLARLRTARLCLEPYNDADPDAIVAGIGDYEVARWLAVVPYPYSRQDALDYIAQSAGTGGSRWSICRDGALIGGISVRPELGYWLARPAWGQGIAVEAATAAIDAYFEGGRDAVLTSGYFLGNDRSARVLQKLGFRGTGRRAIAARALARTVTRQDVALGRAAWVAGRS